MNSILELIKLSNENTDSYIVPMSFIIIIIIISLLISLLIIIKKLKNKTKRNVSFH